MSDSFPNAENLFRDAFTKPEPANELLRILKSHPDIPALMDLVSVYMQLAAEHPTKIHELAEVLGRLKNSKEVIIDASDECGNPAQREIAPVLNRVLADFHSGDLVDADSDASITASNDYLIASLLSAISLKHRLCDSPGQVGSITHGLHFKDRRYRDPPASHEVLVLGACLQLLVSGSYLYGPTGTDVGRDDVLTALEAIKADNVVVSPNGQKLLEATIGQAKAGFQSDIEDAWSILFPRVV